MNHPGQDNTLNAAALREAFDRSFAEPFTHDGDTALAENHLLIGLNGQSHVLPLSGLAGLQALDWVTSVASAWPACLGIMSHKGAILPVYDLRLLLGCAATSAPRWVALTAQPAVALAFDRFDRLLNLPRHAIVNRDAGSVDAQGHAGYFVHTDPQGQQGRYPIVDLPFLLDLIQKTARTRAMQQERSDVDIR